MLEPGMKCKTRNGTPLAEVGTLVVVDKESKKNGAPAVVLGKTGMISCKLPQGGSLFFEESNLKVVSS